jgi:hypothetical protein
MTSSPGQEPQPCDKIIELLELLDRRTRRHTRAIIALVLAVFLLAATIFGYMANYFAAEPLIFGGYIALAGLIAFSIGWSSGWSIGRFVGRRKRL